MGCERRNGVLRRGRVRQQKRQQRRPQMRRVEEVAGDGLVQHPLGEQVSAVFLREIIEPVLRGPSNRFARVGGQRH